MTSHCAQIRGATATPGNGRPWWTGLLLLLLAPSLLAQNSQGHQVIIAGDNATCKNDTSCNATGFTISNCTCNFYVYRASCANAQSCPTPSTPIGPPFTKLTGTPTTTVGANGTHAVYTDNDNALTNATVWSYAMTSQWAVQTTATPESGPSIPTGAVTIPGQAAVTHQAILNYTSSACTTTNNCWFQLWRAVCNLANNQCPSYVTNPDVFVAPPNLNFATWTTTDTGTTWQIIDTDPALADATTYVYVGTTCWAGTCAGYSPPSGPWSGTTTGTSVPLAPTPGTGNTITRKENPIKRLWAKMRGEK